MSFKHLSLTLSILVNFIEGIFVCLLFVCFLIVKM